ncbi:endonuclease domain-containing protein [Streptomyces sp. NPDC050534]|uniref:endonuclease domain-containing protein n=1 Tax=Streptomyces sp. NPDC050534 TaxID=3365625 RepID=UPI0037A3AA0A
MPLIDLKLAQRMLTDLTRGHLIQAAPDALNSYRFMANDHALIGDIPVRGYKHKGRWRLMEEDIRRAGQALADLVVDTGVLTSALPPARRGRNRPPVAGAGWRSHINGCLERAACERHRTTGCRHENWPCPLNDQGLPCDMTWEAFLQRYQNVTIASTLPVPLMSWSGTQWMLPSTYAAVLDRAEEAEDILSAKAAACSKCDAAVDPWTGRSSSAASFVTLCASCASSMYRPYRGHLKGKPYSSLSSRTRADHYLCSLCRNPRRASYWDHCHDHDFVRGPVCGSCNTAEGGGSNFLQRSAGDGVRHLLRCPGCKDGRTLPRRHHLEVVAAAITPDPHHGCTAVTRRQFCRTEADGSVSMHLACWHQDGSEARWVQVIPTAQVLALVSDFVDDVLRREGDATA